MHHIPKTRLFKYIENFTSKKGTFSDKNSDVFHIFAQNIDCGYSLESPRSMFFSKKKKKKKKKKNHVKPCKPQFYYIKVDLRGSKLYRRVFCDDANC